MTLSHLAKLVLGLTMASAIHKQKKRQVRKIKINETSVFIWRVMNATRIIGVLIYLRGTELKKYFAKINGIRLGSLGQAVARYGIHVREICRKVH
jgi:hypothetical protein